MPKKADILNNEDGFILVASLMILIILVIVGITATNTSFIEMLISGNSRFQKQTFFQADGGTEAGINLTYENALCLNTQDGFQAPGAGLDRTIDGNIIVLNGSLGFSDPGSGGGVFLPSDPNPLVPFANPLPAGTRDAVFYTEGILNDNAPHTNLTISGAGVHAPGSSLAQVSGYLGLGYGAAGGGTDLLYTINSQHVGVANSQSIVSLKWRMSGFLVNSASSFDCRY